MLADFPMPVNGSETSLFADDVAIYYTAKTKKEAEGPLQDLLETTTPYPHLQSHDSERLRLRLVRPWIHA